MIPTQSSTDKYKEINLYILPYIFVSIYLHIRVPPEDTVGDIGLIMLFV